MDSRELEQSSRPGCLSQVIFALVWGWTVTITVATQGGAWLAGQILLVEEQPMPGAAWLGASVANAIMLLVLLAPLAWRTDPPRLRAAYQTWSLATLCMVILTLVRFVPEARTGTAAILQIVLCAVSAGLVLRLAGRRRYTLRASRDSVLPALMIAPLVILPWPALGALGSPLDTVLNLLAAASFAILAGVLLDAFLVVPMAAHPSIPGRDILFGGFVAGTALLILAAGFGFGGSHLLMMAALPPLAFAVAGVTRGAAPGPDGVNRTRLPATLLIGIAAAAPLLFFDPKELTVLLDEGDVPTWAAWAAGASALLGLAAGIGTWLMGRASARQWQIEPTVRAVVAVAWAVLLAMYLFSGRPGFYGERLFVILKDQPDVSQAASIPERGERTRFVYQTLTQTAGASQSSLRADLDRLRVSYRSYYLVNALEVDGGPLLRLYLSSRPEVDRVLDSPHLRPLPAPLARGTGDEKAPAQPDWNLTAIGVDRVWKELGVTGKGIVVGQLDSGVDGSHPALRDGYRGRGGNDTRNWLDPWNRSPSPVDYGGHGTHTLGIVLGRENVGVAPDAEWFACSNLARNLGNPAYYLDCMQFALAPHSRGGDPFTDGNPDLAANITNNSWGCPDIEGCDATALLPAVKAMRAAGIFVATAAGNSGPRCGSVLDPPAIYQEAFSAGAMDSKGNVAQFSSRGPVTPDGSRRTKPDILAPGVEVLSSFPGNSYKRESGTSMAGPHLAGVVTLMWSAQPRLVGDIDRTEQILRATARPYEGDRTEGCFQGGVPNNAFGYGVLDAYAAVKAAQEMK